ncbi:MAG: hypothetical protein N3F63_07295 [Thermoplasmata archaeon]|nr:hypothetical protein [Thermoplasmata archaeon]
MPAGLIEKTQKTIEEYIGPFLAEIITRKAVAKAGLTHDKLTNSDMAMVVEKYIVPALLPLISKEKVQECRRKIEMEIRGG